MRYLFVLAFFIFSRCAISQTDTLFNFFNPNGASLIESPNGGFVSGTNGYGDSEKLQAFFSLRSESVLGAYIWFGSKTYNSLDVNSRLCLKVKNIDTSETNTAPFYRGITNTIDSTWISMADVDTGLIFPSGLQYFAFDSPVLVNRFYAIGLNFDSLARDTSGNLLDSVAIFNSAKDSVSAVGMSWEKWNGNYKRIVDTWGFDLDFAIFPVIDTTLNSISKIDIEHLNIYPNPCSQVIRFNIPENRTHLSISIMSIDGRLIYNAVLPENQTVFELNTSSFPTGYYVVKIQNEGWMSVSPLIISHQ
jgi:hypothetical protein